MSKDKPELSACPFCGGTDLNVVQWVECNTCGAFGPTPTDDGDLSNWNSRAPMRTIIQTLHDNGELIALKATVAQQAQMIEHLRGGAPNDPRVVSHAEDMSTCTLTNGDGIGYCYNRVDPDLPAAGYTVVDMGNADASGYRNGFAAAIKSLPEQQHFTNWAAYTEWRAAQIEAVGDFGGEVKP